MIGKKLSERYEILKELGRGGMGVVYLANDPVLERQVAIKLVTPHLLSEEAEERFKREARVVAKMDHPAIVTVHNIGEQEGSLYFVMPYVQGTNLRSELQAGSLSLGDVVEVATQVAEALDYSHSRGVIHRDIKPENILVTRIEQEALRVKITDFGLAIAASGDRLTRSGSIVGTIAYLSPEQVSGEEMDSRCDIYSLGTVLYECLAGETPFTGDIREVLYRVVHENPQPLRSLKPEVEEELERIVMRCLAKDPGKRPQKAKDLAEMLQRYRSRIQDDQRAQEKLSASRKVHFQRPAKSTFVGREKEFTELQRRLNDALLG